VLGKGTGARVSCTRRPHNMQYQQALATLDYAFGFQFCPAPLLRIRPSAHLLSHPTTDYSCFPGVCFALRPR
jgi:hypothetical protein